MSGLLVVALGYGAANTGLAVARTWMAHKRTRLAERAWEAKQR